MMEFANGCLEIFAVLVISVLLINVRLNKLSSLLVKQLIAMVICHMMVLLLDAAHWFLYMHTDLTVLRSFLSISPTCFALVGNAIFVCFAVTLLSEHGQTLRKIIPPLVLLFTFSIVSWAAFIKLNGIQSVAIIQTSHTSMRYSWGYWIGHMGWALVCIIGLILIWRCRQGLKRNELLSLSSYCIFPLIALILRFFWDGPQIFLSTTLSLISIYSVVQRDQQERLHEQETLLVQNRIAILLSQIQPHFLYNTLTAICGLCDENPIEAKKITADFADYLRHNLESLGQNATIPFVNELKHTKAYLAIEKKRFEDKLNIVYDITTEDFFIPALSLQPLVENAVKHGVRKANNNEGGTVTIRTTKNANNYEVLIIDDGVGFNSNILSVDDKMHIGIENVRARLYSMCKGTLIITSKVGQGTTVTINIPKGDKI